MYPWSNSFTKNFLDFNHGAEYDQSFVESVYQDLHDNPKKEAKSQLCIVYNCYAA